MTNRGDEIRILKPRRPEDYLWVIVLLLAGVLFGLGVAVGIVVGASIT